jgi:hypothetical protein
LTVSGRQLRSERDSKLMSSKPPIKPTTGYVTMGARIFQRMPFPCHQCSLPGTDQTMEDQRLPEAASMAPQSPLTSAWDELEGKPNHQVNRLQRMAAGHFCWHFLG